jgi:uncharacterized protein
MKKIMFDRTLFEGIDSWLFEGKVIILYGPRQVGKTTLAKSFIAKYPGSLYLNCELFKVKDVLESNNLENIKSYLGDHRMVIFDEAQKIRDIGLLLKILTDTCPEYQIIATGSSSFELSDELSEPLTGRNLKFIMYPVSLVEAASVYSSFGLDEKIENMLRFGMYPDILGRNENQQCVLLDELSSDYLFKDALKFEKLKRTELLFNLLKAIALQLGSEVSVRELSNLLKTSSETIQRYLNILERAFIIFKLNSFSRNLRNEIAKSRKYYFYDTGIRNSLIQNYNSLSLRNDTGALWENFCIIEKLKLRQKMGRGSNLYFWRTYQQQEIDLIEEADGQLKAYEFKWNPNNKVKAPKLFLNTYPESEFHIIHRDNYKKFLM